LQIEEIFLKRSTIWDNLGRKQYESVQLIFVGCGSNADAHCRSQLLIYCSEEQDHCVVCGEVCVNFLRRLFFVTGIEFFFIAG
jgi:hypothetical protein